MAAEEEVQEVPVTASQLRQFFTPEGIPHYEIAVRNMALHLRDQVVNDRDNRIKELEAQVAALTEPELPEPPGD
jgi:hypothetical protein